MTNLAAVVVLVSVILGVILARDGEAATICAGVFVGTSVYLAVITLCQ